MAGETYSVKIEGIKKLLRKLDNAARDDVIRYSLHQGGIILAGWSAKNRLSEKPGSTQYLHTRSGRLKSSLLNITANTPTEKVGNAYIQKIGTNVEYARIHEFGGYAGRNRAVRIPARPYLRPALANRENQQEVLNILTQNINKALEK